MINRFVFGMGTGRCGTWTLSRILDAQEDFIGIHESVPLPWNPDPGHLWHELIKLAVANNAKTVASVSFCWINYVGKIMGNLIDPKCICLFRPKDEVVKSFMAHTPTLNHWTDVNSVHWNPNKYERAIRSVMWPDYDLPKKEAIGQYWEDYYKHAQYLEQRYPGNFRIFDFKDVLNTESGQSEMLTFIGIAPAKQLIFLNQKLNALHKPKGELKEPLHV